MSGADFDALAAAVERLTLNDASVSLRRESSAALGAGFRCGCAPCTAAKRASATYSILVL